MKKYTVIYAILCMLFPLSLSSQNFNQKDISKFQSVQHNKKQYENLQFTELLKDLPEIKMLRIMPNNPQPDVHTFIIGFMNNSEFSRSENKKRVTVYLKGKIGLKDLFKEDLSTEEAIKKYGNLKIATVL